MKWFCLPSKASEPAAPVVGDPTPSENVSSTQAAPVAEVVAAPVAALVAVPEAAAKKACCPSAACCLPKFPICRKPCGQPLVLRSTPPTETEKVIPAVEVSAPVAVSDQASATEASASVSQ